VAAGEAVEEFSGRRSPTMQRLAVNILGVVLSLLLAYYGFLLAGGLLALANVIFAYGKIEYRLRRGCWPAV
jgi:hypothetical protein